MSACTLSVVVVALNESDNLEKTIDCLQSTLPESSELLVIDDGSTDGCSDFLSGRSGVTLYRTDQIGIARARNLGAARTQGEIVVFSDAHVQVPPGWWSPLATALQASSIGAAGPAICDMVRFRILEGYGIRFEGPDLLEYELDAAEEGGACTKCRNCAAGFYCVPPRRVRRHRRIRRRDDLGGG